MLIWPSLLPTSDLEAALLGTGNETTDCPVQFPF